MKNPFENFTENECIHCQTDAEAKAITELNPKNNCGYKLSQHGYNYYFPKKSYGSGVWKNLKYINDNNSTTHPASKFLTPTFEYLEEVEVSDNNVDWEVWLFGCFFPETDNHEKKVVAFHKTSLGTNNWKHIRKLNTERTKAIETIKDLADKFDIKLNEI